MDDVDAAVRNSLTVRFELGLFDPPASLGELATLVRNESNEQNHSIKTPKRFFVCVSNNDIVATATFPRQAQDTRENTYGPDK
jgi:hypothetical protein